MTTSKMTKGMYSSTSFEWRTPSGIFKALEKEFGPFDLDPCADPKSRRGRNFYSIDEGWSGLAKKWEGHVFMNPPYGRQIIQWVEKAYDEANRGALVVCLIPCRTDTRWWHDFVMKADEIRFIRGRLKFMQDNGIENSAPFPSAIVVFGKGNHRVHRGKSSSNPG